MDVDFDDSFGNSDSIKESGFRKRFLELSSMLEPGRPPKTDKAAILGDAVRVVNQLRGEAQQLKDSNGDLQEKINELKAEKNELRDEKQRLKTEKENIERQIKALNTQPGFLPHPAAIPGPFSAPGQVVGGKLMPFVGYPGVSMWQFMPPAAVDTSQDHVLRPPVA
ncbi:basic helix-loop-helix DNA-binding superfamily protein [Prunus dulcis]|uniref:Basic helix-loop-helix DNA-binding superfamily protein n=1 Tax=Prunus dulcis TaxID=3755 RepID=A0A4Y1R9W2_PRUDU|nr:basic helix-loop-helix DNA-binding superfamily protein [Prunus dulcis]